MKKIPRKQRPEYVETAIGDEVIVMHLASGEFFSLTGSAATIWRLVDGERSSEDIMHDLMADHTDSAGDIPADVIQFLDHLAEIGLIELG